MGRVVVVVSPEALAWKQAPRATSVLADLKVGCQGRVIGGWSGENFVFA